MDVSLIVANILQESTTKNGEESCFWSCVEEKRLPSILPHIFSIQPLLWSNRGLLHFILYKTFTFGQKQKKKSHLQSNLVLPKTTPPPLSITEPLLQHNTIQFIYLIWAVISISSKNTLKSPSSLIISFFSFTPI